MRFLGPTIILPLLAAAASLGVEGFSTGGWKIGGNPLRVNVNKFLRKDSRLFMVQATPPPRKSFSSFPKRPRIQKRRGPTDPAEARNKWHKAQSTESKLAIALESLQQATALERSLANESRSSESVVAGLLFPSIRECNAALATFGDGGELLRALRLFMKMRKASLLAKHLQGKAGWSWPVPSPTLVTYSTIMSRANRMGKPRVALRMWKLMQKTPDCGYSSDEKTNGVATMSSTSSPLISSIASDEIVPDTKAANILMNSFAKLADVASAQDLLYQMQFGNGTDVPQLEPNLVTFNTFLDACHKAHDLDAALDAMNQLEQSGLKPDAWSYTSLIATVARKPSSTSGANDPSLAFSFLNEMRERDIEPNGMTYSALIDACGRCGRCDLALQGLRIMLRQKAAVQRSLALQQRNNNENDNERKRDGKRNNKSSGSGYKGKPEHYSLSNEVGAWTAAINALGKEGRVNAAVRLFFSMPNFGVQPNTVTCGCLVDSLLKQGRTADTLRVLRYMEENGIAPSEVMYTSLMSSAGNMAQQEQKNSAQVMGRANDEDVNDSAISQKVNNAGTFPPSCNSIEVYSLLMKSLLEDRTGGAKSQRKSPLEIREAKSHSLMQVFLVFQEMKEAGAQPDLACYNALLRACARAGDVSRAQSVLSQLEEDALEPNDNSWRELIRAAGNAKRCDIVISTWKKAMSYSYDVKSHLGSINPQLRSSHWTPSIQTFSSMISALLRAASDHNLPSLERRRLYQWVVVMYQRVLSGNRDEQLGMHRVDLSELGQDSRVMLLILQAVVSMDQLTPIDGSHPNALTEKSQLRGLATSIVELKVLQGITQKQRLGRSAFRCLSIAQSWAERDATVVKLRP